MCGHMKMKGLNIPCFSQSFKRFMVVKVQQFLNIILSYFFFFNFKVFIPILMDCRELSGIAQKNSILIPRRYNDYSVALGFLQIR